MARLRTVRVAPDVPRSTAFPIATGVAELRDDPDGTTTLWVNGVPSSPLDPDPDALAFEYMRHMSAAVDAWGGPSRLLALHIGAAACTLPRHLAHRLPGSGHIAVDVDATLPELVRTWWDLPRAPRLRIRAQDGLEALATRRDASLDLVIRDAFSGDSVPEHLTTVGWWAHAARVLRSDGLVLANVGSRPGSGEAAADARAAAEACGGVVAIGEPAVLRGRRRGNVVLAVTPAGGIDVGALRRYAASAPLPTGVVESWSA